MTTVTVIAGDLMADKLGSVNPERYKDETFELYSIPAYDQGEPEILNGAKIGSSKQLVQEGDVLLSRIVPHIRRAWVVGTQSDLRKIGSGEWIVFRHPAVYPRYLRYYLLNDSFHSRFMQTVSGVGGSLLRARPDSVAGIPITLPPLSEQKRIAALLEKADRVRRLRRYAREMSDGFLQSVFRKMFGDPVRNGKDRLESIVEEIEAGVNYRPADSSKTPLKVLKVSAVSWLEFNPDEAKFIATGQKVDKNLAIRNGDLLVSRANTVDLVAAAVIARSDYPDRLLPDKIWRLKLFSDEPANKEFLLHALRTPAARQFFTTVATGTSDSMKNISQENFLRLPITTAPDSERSKFAAIAARHRTMQRQLVEAERQAEHLFQTLLHRAFAEG